MSIAVRRIRAHEVALARDLRLRALASDPAAFGSSYEREIAYEEAFWVESARRHAESEDCAIFVAFCGHEAVGLVRGARDDGRPGVYFVHSMWVVPEARRSGVARALLESVETWITAHGGSVSELAVTSAAPAARRLYESCGYVADGHVEPSPRHAGVTEHRMRKIVSRAG